MGPLPTLDLTVASVTIVDAESPFWDKVVILHGLRRWFDARQVLRGVASASHAIITICID